MTTQFLSRVDREIIKNDANSLVGPGSYMPPSSLKKDLPGFAPFNGTSKRMSNKMLEDSPAPGSYNIGEDMLKKKGINSSFKSSSQRFNEMILDEGPGPGTYTAPSTFRKSKPKTYTTSSLRGKLDEILPHQPRQAPSIPTRFQGYGYEQGANGFLELQDPVNPGYSGKVYDSVGPCDYNPSINCKYRSAPYSNFSKGAQRDSLDKIAAKNADIPGPGYYNSHSTFDVPADSRTGGDNDTDFLMQLNAARKRQSAVFESKTKRDSMLKFIAKRQHEPGPGAYDIPHSIKAVTKPVDKQFFASSGARFQDPLPRSMRLSNSAPSNTIISSDFDQMRLKILKQKKMASRSGWAQNIAFTSTEARFQDNQYDNEVPPSSTYYPKVGISDHVAKPNARGGAFGSKDQRFKESKIVDTTQSKEQVAVSELNRDITGFLASSHKEHSLDSSGSNTNRQSRPKYTCNFAPSSEDRSRPVKTPPGPPPGAYDLQPKWIKSSAVVMAPSTVVSKKVVDVTPGPGQYNLSRRIGNPNTWNNPKNIMLTTAPREERKSAFVGPGPQDYNVLPASGLLRPSHNVLLSDNHYGNY